MAVELTPKGTRGVKMPKLPRPIMKAFFGLFSAVLRRQGAQLLTLTTVGAKSGRQRAVPLRYFPDGPNAWLVVASYGGTAAHPAWYINMARNPDQVWMEIGNRKLRVQPESLKDAEREMVWRRLVAEAPGYAAYQEKTDREIPIIRLQQVTSSPTKEQ